MSLVDDAIETLKNNKRGLAGSELTALLQSLGFTVRNGSKIGHRVVTHSGLPDFFSASFTVGHGKDDSVKLPYVLDLIRVLKMNRAELERLNQ